MNPVTKQIYIYKDSIGHIKLNLWKSNHISKKLWDHLFHELPLILYGTLPNKNYVLGVMKTE